MPVLTNGFRDKLYQAIEEMKEEIVSDTAHILTYETISGGETEEEKALFNKEITRCLSWLKEFTEKNDLQYRSLDGVVSVIDQPGESDEPGLGIPLHIDVVPVTGDWKYPPFSGTVADGIIWGRGTQDDKGPLMACLFALKALKKCGVTFKLPVHIIMGMGEEVGYWADVQYFLEKETPPAFSFTPDAQFPIINGEKGIINLKVNAKWEEAESFNPIRLVSISGGVRANVVPDRAEVILAAGNADSAMKTVKNELEAFCSLHEEVKYTGPEKEGDHIKVVFKGKSAHGSLPHEGHNAILDAILFLSERDYASKDCKNYLSFIHRTCAPPFGEGWNIAKEHHFVGKTTVNLGIFKADEKGGKAVINIRPTLGLPCKEVGETAKKIVRAEKEKSGLDVFVIEDEVWGKEALFVDPEENKTFISSLQTAYGEVTGYEPELMSIGGTTFAKAYPNCVTFGPFDPHVEKELAHMTDEHVKIEHQMRNVKIYAYSMALLVTDAPTTEE